uniref:Uncharacterized protein n=1 Tax=Anguilla anguilla TaxID=7936 RepID=A0A0E9T2W7_ANGAN
MLVYSSSGLQCYSIMIFRCKYRMIKPSLCCFLSFCLVV